MRHFIIAGFTFSVITLVLVACNSNYREKTNRKGELKGTISISGAFALYPMTVKWAEEFNKQYPAIRIDISAGGAGKGMTDVLSGMVHLAMFSREISQAEISKGAWYVAVAKDAVLPTISSQNPVLADILQKGFTKEMFQRLYLEENLVSWGELLETEDRNNVNVYTRSDACGAAEMWGKYLGASQENLHGVGVYGDPGIADAVKNDRFGTGYNNVIYIYDIKSRLKYKGMEIIPLDINGNRQVDPEEDFYNNLDSIMNAIQAGIYPSPPARELYFVSKGKPADPIVIIFLDWVLTEGQKFVHEGGYVQLSDDIIKREQLKLQ